MKNRHTPVFQHKGGVQGEYTFHGFPDVSVIVSMNVIVCVFVGTTSGKHVRATYTPLNPTFI